VGAWAIRGRPNSWVAGESKIVQTGRAMLKERTRIEKGTGGVQGGIFKLNGVTCTWGGTILTGEHDQERPINLKRRRNHKPPLKATGQKKFSESSETFTSAKMGKKGQTTWTGAGGKKRGYLRKRKDTGRRKALKIMGRNIGARMRREGKEAPLGHRGMIREGHRW